MEIIDKHNVDVISDSDWGYTYESNINTIAMAMETCHDTTIKNKEKSIDKYVFNVKHYPLLEFSNIEFSLRHVNNKDKFPISDSLYLRDKTKMFNILFNDKEYKEHKEMLYICNGSWRDLMELIPDLDSLSKLKSFHYAMRYGYKLNDSWILEDSKIPYRNVNKRVLLMLQTNQDVSRKLRSERSISQLSLSSSHNNHDVLIGSDLNLIDKSLLDESLLLSNKIYDNLDSCNLTDKRKSYLSRKFRNQFLMTNKIMVGRSIDFINMCNKRIETSSKNKKEIINACTNIKNMVDKYIKGDL